MASERTRARLRVALVGLGGAILLGGVGYGIKTLLETEHSDHRGAASPPASATSEA